MRRNSKLLYILEVDKDEALFLAVTCGGVGMYDVKFKLTVEERGQYLEDGDTFLDRLALQITKSSSDFDGQAIML